MYHHLFWLVATTYIWLAVGLTLLASKRMRGHADEGAGTTLTGQRKDNWLACAVIWITLLNDGSAAKNALFLSGGIVMVWLVGRTAWRVRLLNRSRRN